MKVNKNPILTIIGASLALALVGCGSSDSNTTTSNTTSTTASSSTHNATTCPNGTLVTNDDDLKLCKTEQNIPYRPYYNQILKSAYPTGFYKNTATGYTVKEKDTIQATGVSGEIGFIDSTFNACITIFGNSSCANECEDVTDLAGINSKGQTEKIGSTEKGLAASNGTEVVNIGNGDKHTFSKSGSLHLGWNVNGLYACPDGYISITSITITHCEDGNGTTYECP